MTNSTNSKRFNNRESVVKGFIINTKTQEFKPFETKVSYVRSTEKAVKLVREQMNITEPEIIVSVNKVINEAPKPIKYNNIKIYELAYNRFNDEETAKNTANKDNTEMRVITVYEISGQIWALSGNEYKTESYADEAFINLTKVNAREFIKMSYEKFIGNKVLGIHGCTKHEKQVYCVITRDNLQKCITKKTKLN